MKSNLASSVHNKGPHPFSCICVKGCGLFVYLVLISCVKQLNVLRCK